MCRKVRAASRAAGAGTVCPQWDSLWCRRARLTSCADLHRFGHAGPTGSSVDPLQQRVKLLDGADDLVTVAVPADLDRSRHVSRAARAFAFIHAIAMIEICGFTPEEVGNVEPSQTTTLRTS